MIKNILKKTQVLFFVVMSSLYFSDIALSFGKLKKDKKPTGGKTAEEVKKLATDFVKLTFDSKSEVVKTDFELTLKVSYDNYTTLKTFLVPIAAAATTETPAATTETQSYILDYYKAFNAEPTTTPAAGAEIVAGGKQIAEGVNKDVTKIGAEIAAGVTGTIEGVNKDITKVGVDIAAKLDVTVKEEAAPEVKPEEALAQLLEGIWDETVDVGTASFGAKIKEWLGQKDYTTGLAKLVVDATGVTTDAEKKSVVQTILGKIEINFATEWKADTSFEMTFKVNLGETIAVPETLDEIHKKTDKFLTIETVGLDALRLVDLQRMGYHVVKFTFGEEVKTAEVTGEDKKDPVKALTPMLNRENGARLIQLMIADAMKSDGELTKLETPGEGTVGKLLKDKLTVVKSQNGLVSATVLSDEGMIQSPEEAKAFPTGLKAAPFLEWNVGADHYVVFEREVDPSVKTFALNYRKILEQTVNRPEKFLHAKYQRLIGNLLVSTGQATPTYDGYPVCPDGEKAIGNTDSAKATKDLTEPSQADAKAIEFPAKLPDDQLPICYSLGHDGKPSLADMKASAFSLVGLNFAVFQEEPHWEGPQSDAMKLLVAKGFFQFAHAISKLTKDASVPDAYQQTPMMRFIQAITKDVQTTIQDGDKEYNLLEMMTRANAFTVIAHQTRNLGVDTTFEDSPYSFRSGFPFVMSDNDLESQFSTGINEDEPSASGVSMTGVNLANKFRAGSIFVDFGTGAAAAFSMRNIIFYKRYYDTPVTE